MRGRVLARVQRAYEEHGGLPSFVEDEFESYLTRGWLESDCLELEGRKYGYSMLGYDQGLCRDATAAFAEELSRSLKRCAKRVLALPRLADALTELNEAIRERLD